MISNVTLIVLFASIYFTYRYVTRTFNYWKKKGVVGPEPIPLFGNLKESALRRKHVAVIYKEIYDSYPGEDYVGIYRMTSPSLVIRNLDIAKQILIKDFEIFPYRGYDFSKEGLGDNLFHAGGETWRGLWHKLTPYFTSEKIKNSLCLLKDCGDKFINHLENITLIQQEQEVLQLFRKYTMATAMSFGFGIQVDTFDENNEIFEKIDKSIFEYSYLNEIDMMYPGILTKANSSLFNKLINKFCYEILETIKVQRGKQPTGLNNVVDLLLKLKLDDEEKLLKSFSEDSIEAFTITDHVIAGQVFVFFAAGYGNNFIVLSNALYYLSKNPDLQNKLVAEIEEVLQRNSGELTYGGLKEMKYLDYTLNETLRMHPTTNAISRRAVKDYTIPGTKVTLEKGTNVVISPLAIHNDESIYPNPEKFDPERFTSVNSKGRHSCAYIPFGLGPRTCLGMQFAKVQFKVCVVKVLTKFWVEPTNKQDDTIKYNPRRSLLCQEGGIHLKFLPRT